jgi:hypothetical protein
VTDVEVCEVVAVPDAELVGTVDEREVFDELLVVPVVDAVTDDRDPVLEYLDVEMVCEDGVAEPPRLPVVDIMARLLLTSRCRCN